MVRAGGEIDRVGDVLDENRNARRELEAVAEAAGRAVLAPAHHGAVDPPAAREVVTGGELLDLETGDPRLDPASLAAVDRTLARSSAVAGGSEEAVEIDTEAAGGHPEESSHHEARGDADTRAHWARIAVSAERSATDRSGTESHTHSRTARTAWRWWWRPRTHRISAMKGASGENAPTADRPLLVDRYAIYDAIASGGMATVHLGRLIGTAGFLRTVAIKRLHSQFANDADFTAMLLDEARLASRIQHPNVVSTLDVVMNDNELLLVMEYVRGESLSRLIRRGPRPR